MGGRRGRATSLRGAHERRKKALRLLAWQRIPSKAPGKADELVEPYDCLALCWDQGEEDFRDRSRAELGCTRVDLEPVEWHVDADLLRRHYQGREPLVHAEPGVRNPRYPTESPEDGCPGGWYRSRFVRSVIPYLRRRTADGGRVQNPFFDRADELVWSWCLYFEEQQERAEVFRAAAIRKQREQDS